MNKDVSCGVLLSYFEELRRRGLPPEIICKDVPYTLRYLRNKRERIEWDVFCTLTANLRSYLNDEELESMGFVSIRAHPFFSAAAVIVRLLFTGPELYFWVNDPVRGPSHQMFTCMYATTELAGKNHVITTLTLNPGYVDCREFFLVTKGALRACTTLLGLPPARVEMRWIDRGAVYDIWCPEGGGALSWLRRALAWPWNARTVARELKEANEALLARYAQLEEAQARIQHQAMQLQTAFSISDLIRRNLDLDSTAEAVARSLVEAAHFAAARVTVFQPNQSEGAGRVLVRGTLPPDEPVLTRILEARDCPIGELSVGLHPGTDPSEAEKFLDQIVPSIAMEINDALSFTLLKEYRLREMLVQQEFLRHQIESQEAERKRLAAELHDGLGQDLLVASNELQRFLREGNGSTEDLKQASALLQESIQTVRGISSNLHPHQLERLGFRAAVETLTENLGRSTGINVHRSCDDVDLLLPKETQIHVYRVMQEALANAVRHSSARNVTVHVQKAVGSIEITVEDDGRGFDPQEAADREPSPHPAGRNHGFGLSSMKERMRISGGTLAIASAPGSGTRIHLSLPYS